MAIESRGTFAAQSPSDEIVLCAEESELPRNVASVAR
jgi:hypothetical protein